MSLSRDQLDRAECACGKPECDNDRVYFHGICHPGDPTYVYYDKSTGDLSIVCATCEEFIAAVAVASLS